MSAASQTYRTMESAQEAYSASVRATPEQSARHDEMLRQRNAEMWFRTELLRFERHLSNAAPANTSEPAQWIVAANWAGRLNDLTVCATAAQRGLVTWSEAKAMFDEMELDATSVEDLVRGAVTVHRERAA